MIDILFINPAHLKLKYLKLEGNEIPLGLCYLASFLEKKEFKTEILDLNFYKNKELVLINYLKKFNPRFVGLTGNTIDMINLGEIAKTVKSLNTDIRIVVGGPHVSALPKRTLKEFKEIDYIIYGEGEVTLKELVKGVKENKINGLVYRQRNNIRKNKPRKFIKNIDTLPFPARHKLELKKYIPLPGNYRKLPSSAIATSRGCPYNCTFCNKIIFSNIIRYRSPENIIKEIEHCINEYGIHDFRFNDDTLTINRKRIKKLCRLIIDKNLDITWNCYSRVEHVDLGLLKLMKRTGCYHIKYGLESGSEKILKKLNKTFSLEQARKAIRLTKKIGIETKTSFMLGIPGETIRDIEKTIKFAKLISADITSFLVFTPLPGSKLYNELDKNKKLKHHDWDKYSHHNEYLIKDIDEKIIKKYFKKVYLEFYLRPNYFLQRFKRMIKDPRNEIRMIYNGIRILSPLLR